jgi:hypothetical protein
VKISRPAADSDGSLTDEILMLGRLETEADEPTVVPAVHAARRRIIFAAAAAVVLAGCATLAGSLTSTGSTSPRPVPHAAPPQAAAPNQPTPAPAPAKPTHAGSPKIRPAPRHKPAPTRPPVQVAAPGVLHGQPVTTRHTNTPPKQQPAAIDTHPNRAGGTSALSQDALPNLDTARARIRQVSVIISDLSRQADAISRIMGLPRPPNEQ